MPWRADPGRISCAVRRALQPPGLDDGVGFMSVEAFVLFVLLAVPFCSRYGFRKALQAAILKEKKKVQSESPSPRVESSAKPSRRFSVKGSSLF